MRKSYKTEPCPRCRRNGRDSRGDNLVIWPDESAHCFACGYHRPSPLSIKLTKLHTEETNFVPKALLPHDFTRDIPANALKWLLQWGLPYTYWQETIGYSPAEKRLIFKVGTPVAFSIGRLLDGPGRKWYAWGDCHRHAEVINPGNKIVLVEDWISAHKVANAGYTTIPLFGTEVHTPVIYHLINAQEPVSLWLDKDQRSLVAKKASRLASVIGRPVNFIFTDKDPKQYSFQEIRKELN